MRLHEFITESKQAEAPKPRNFVAKNAKSAGAGKHKDAKKSSQQVRGQKHKKQEVAEVAPKGWEGTVKAMKKHKDIDNPYALANWMKNKGYKSHKKEGIEEGSGGDKYKVRSIGTDKKGDYYISPKSGQKVYKKGVAVGDHEVPDTGEIKKKVAEAFNELAEEFDLIESIINTLAEHHAVDAELVWEDLENLTDDELYAFAVTSEPVNEDWQKVNKHDRTSGMSQKAVNAYRRENPGSKLKTAVTTKPSKLKRGSKASKRRKSYCSRSRGQMKMHSINCSKTPDKAICAARRRWNC